MQVVSYTLKSKEDGTYGVHANLSDGRSPEVGFVHRVEPHWKVASQVAALTDAQRLELFSLYCKYCGRNDPGCQCWNDE